MHKIRVVVIDPKFKKTDFSFNVNMPAVPNSGDYIELDRKNDSKIGYEHFIVNRRLWFIELDDSSSNSTGKMEQIGIEVKYALCPERSSEQHKEFCETQKCEKFKSNPF